MIDPDRRGAVTRADDALPREMNEPERAALRQAIRLTVPVLSQLVGAISWAGEGSDPESALELVSSLERRLHHLHRLP